MSSKSGLGSQTEQIKGEFELSTDYPVSVTTASKVATELLRRPQNVAGAFLQGISNGS